jgi:hypothetical protein
MEDHNKFGKCRPQEEQTIAHRPTMPSSRLLKEVVNNCNATTPDEIQ